MSGTTDRVIYRGVSMVAGWPERIREAQSVTEIEVEGRTYARVRYGDEAVDLGKVRDACPDCAVIKNEFHVVGCDMEQCPACGGQAISCGCDG